MSRVSTSIAGEYGEVLTAARVLSAEDHGKTFFLNLAGGFAVTLPAPEVGLKFYFVVKTAPTTAYTVITNASANIMLGHCLTSEVTNAAVADSEISGGDTFSFVANQAVVGDRAVFLCDGTKWYVMASSKSQAGLTITTAS